MGERLCKCRTRGGQTPSTELHACGPHDTTSFQAPLPPILERNFAPAWALPAANEPRPTSVEHTLLSHL